MERDNRRLYSSMRFEGDGVTKVVALTFELREGDGLSVDFGYGLVDSGYIIDYDSQPVLIIFDEPLPKQTITIRRLTQISEVPHVFQKTGNAQGGSPFNAKNIDENFENITRASQDAMDSQVLASETLEEMSGIRDDAIGYRDEAEESVRKARESEDSARISASASLTGATASAQSASKAEGHELKAKAWATNPENVEVEGGKYSAYHWAVKAKESVGFDIEEYRKLDDNIFNGYLQVRSENEGQETCVSLQDTDGTVRGQVVATDQGLQLTQYPEEGGLQTFTFPNTGGEILTDGKGKWTMPEEGGELALKNSRLNPYPVRAGIPEIIAHRGFSDIFPENTTEALSQAYYYGATSVEFDVQVSADGVAYLYHDDTLDSLTTGTGKISEVTSEYIDTLTYKPEAPNTFQGVKLSKLSDALKQVPQEVFRVYPEIKQDLTVDQVAKVVDEVYEHWDSNRVVWQSFYYEVLHRITARDSNALVGFLSAFEDLDVMKEEVSRLVSDFRNPVYLPESDTVLNHPEIVKYCRDSNVEIAVWTVFRYPDVNKLKLINVNKMMSNRFLGF